MFLKQSALALFCVALWMVCFAGSKPPQIIMRVYTQTDDNGSPNQTIPIQLTKPDEQIFVSVIAEASEKDIVSIDPYTGPNGDAGAVFHFNAHAVLNLNATTMQNQGKILVVMLDGRIIYSPVIDSVISDGILLVPRGIQPQEFALLQAMVKENAKNSLK